jgi:hypothetical protein
MSRTFPGFSFFGVIFRQFPVAMPCPQAQDLTRTYFSSKTGGVGLVATIHDLKFFFAAELVASRRVGIELRLVVEMKNRLNLTPRKFPGRNPVRGHLDVEWRPLQAVGDEPGPAHGNRKQPRGSGSIAGLYQTGCRSRKSQQLGMHLTQVFCLRFGGNLEVRRSCNRLSSGCRACGFLVDYSCSQYGSLGNERPRSL